MATQTWLGSAVAVQQVRTFTVGGSPAAGDTFSLTVGNKTFTAVAPIAPTTATTAAAIYGVLSAISATLNLEFAGLAYNYTSGSNSLTISGAAGVPFDIQTAVGSGNTGSGTFAWSDTVPASGPNFADVGANWSTGAAPASGDDVYLTNSSVSILYGLSMSGVALHSLNCDATFTGTVGLPRNRGQSGAQQTAEYLPQYWEIGAATVNLNTGGGRFKLNTGAGGANLTITGAASSAEAGIKTILWLGTGTNNISISKGSLAAANFPNETATIATLNQEWQTNQSGDTDVRLGPGCAITTVNKTGGALEINSAVSTLSQNGKGATTFNGGAQGTLSVYAGSLLFGEIASYTALTVDDGGTADFRRGGGAVTGTNTSLSGNYTFLDPGKRITFTNPLAIASPGAQADLDLGSSYHLQRS